MKSTLIALLLVYVSAGPCLFFKNKGEELFTISKENIISQVEEKIDDTTPKNYSNDSHKFDITKLSASFNFERLETSVSFAEGSSKGTVSIKNVSMTFTTEAKGASQNGMFIETCNPEGKFGDIDTSVEFEPVVDGNKAHGLSLNFGAVKMEVKEPAINKPSCYFFEAFEDKFLEEYVKDQSTDFFKKVKSSFEEAVKKALLKDLAEFPFDLKLSSEYALANKASVTSLVKDELATSFDGAVLKGETRVNAECEGEDLTVTLPDGFAAGESAKIQLLKDTFANLATEGKLNYTLKQDEFEGDNKKKTFTGDFISTVIDSNELNGVDAGQVVTFDFTAGEVTEFSFAEDLFLFNFKASYSFSLKKGEETLNVVVDGVMKNKFKIEHESGKKLSFVITDVEFEEPKLNAEKSNITLAEGAADTTIQTFTDLMNKLFDDKFLLINKDLEKTPISLENKRFNATSFTSSAEGVSLFWKNGQTPKKFLSILLSDA